MGLCCSVDASSVHVAEYDYGVFDIVVYENQNSTTESKVGSIYSQHGLKGLNQDTAILYQGYGVEDGAFCGVFDGHGKNGHIASKIVRNRLASFIMNHRLALGKLVSTSQASTSSPEFSEKLLADQEESNKNLIEWKEAFISSFDALDKEIELDERFDFSCSGTAAVVALKQGDDLIIANLGDSRAILATKTNEGGVSAIQLTTDQKPSVSCEADRIRSCNGRVFALDEETHIQRVWLPDEKFPGLAMSRAFGDFVLKKHGLISLPEVSYHHLSPDDLFVVLATDGVWDVLNNDEVAAIVCSNSKEEAAKAVVDASIEAWARKYPNSLRDDSTVICLFLQTSLPLNT